MFMDNFCTDGWNGVSPSAEIIRNNDIEPKENEFITRSGILSASSDEFFLSITHNGQYNCSKEHFMQLQVHNMRLCSPKQSLCL